MKVPGSPATSGCVTTPNSEHCRTELRELNVSDVSAVIDVDFSCTNSHPRAQQPTEAPARLSTDILPVLQSSTPVGQLALARSI
jgi:hypothetical protein